MLLKRNVKELLTKESNIKTIKIIIMMYLSKNFQEKEFVCKCGHCKSVPLHLKENLILLCQQLEKIRFYTGPIIINSGVRCELHNKKVGGVTNSQHLVGRAADIQVKSMYIEDLYNKIQELRRQEVIKIGYIQLYKKQRFIHIDVRGIK